MEALHYSHQLPWISLVDLYRSNKYTPIKLPTGECKKVHVINCKVKNQLKTREFLQICQDPNCQVIGYSEFRKKSELTDEMFKNKTANQSCQVKNYFFDKFKEAVFDFIRTFKKDNIKIETLELTGEEHYTFCTDCNIFIQQLESKNLKELDKYTIDELKNIFSCQHGGQAVGINLRFLLHYVINVYLLTNLIYASGNRDNQNNWHEMAPENYFRRQLMYSCDGQTFLPSLRKYLSDDVYMKDLNGTKELCKKLFEFICYFTMYELKIRDEDRLGINYYSELVWV